MFLLIETTKGKCMLKELINVVAEIGDTEELEAFFKEIFTEKELMDLGLRWQLMQELKAGETQRSIASRHHISLCKITRGSKILKDKNSISNKYLPSISVIKAKL